VAAVFLWLRFDATRQVAQQPSRGRSALEM